MPERLIHAELSRPLPLGLDVFTAACLIEERRQLARLLRRSEQKVLSLRRLKEPVDGRPERGAAAGHVVRGAEPGTPLRCLLQHPRAIRPHAEIHGKAAAELNGVLRVEGQERRICAAGEHEGVVFIVLEHGITEVRFFGVLLVRDKKREVLVEAQPRRLDSRFQDMLTALMRHAGENAGAPKRTIGIDVERCVVLTAEKLGRARPMVCRELRDRVTRPRSLPGCRLPCLKIGLPLILSPFFLIFVVRHIEPRTPGPSDDGQRARRRGEPVELRRPVRGTAPVVKVVRVHRIEEPIRSLSGDPHSQRLERPVGPPKTDEPWLVASLPNDPERCPATRRSCGWTSVPR